MKKTKAVIAGLIISGQLVIILSFILPVYETDESLLASEIREVLYDVSG